MRYTIPRRPFFTVERAIGIKRHRGHILYRSVNRNPLDALGRTLQQTAVPPTPILSGMANETTLDTWSYDPIYGAGDVGLIKRQRGSNSASPAANPTVWQESYSYEAGTSRPLSSTTTISEGGAAPGALVSSTGYDSAGRPSTHTYPSGLSVLHTYTAYGQLGSLSNASTGAVYWTALAQNEWGHVTSESYSGGIVGTHSDYHSTGQAHTLSWGGASTDGLSYSYDSFGNLVGQSRSAPNANTENYSYDALQRLTTATRILGGAVNYSYSPSGNILSKSDYGSSYGYQANGCGPHAASSISVVAALGAGTLNYSCDANGNVVTGTGGSANALPVTTTFDASEQFVGQPFAMAH